MFAVGLRLNWLGKHTMFFWPAKYLLRWLGGEAVDRSTPAGVVDAAIERFRGASQWVFGVSPEGTRKLTTEWKTGFYRIATGAGVPILPVALDYHRRVLAIGALMWPSGDTDADITRLRASFHRGMARRPEHFFELDPETPTSHP
jgi:1-acyl-sn-glycerol-3-phosphate acyltransferase